MKETGIAELDRLPHQATRAVVEALGHEAPRALYRAFDRFNIAYFDGNLGAPLLFVMHTMSPRALGDYCGRDVHGLRSRIRIAPKVLARGERFATDILLHEMVHAYQSEIDGDSELGYKGHGPRFASKCNAIGATLGLPPVGVKGRGGLPDCAQWPMCVRPANYYPFVPEPRPSPKGRRERREPPPNRGGVRADPLRLIALLAEGVRLVEALPEDPRCEFGLEAWLQKARSVTG